jgi:hypothetical protein
MIKKIAIKKNTTKFFSTFSENHHCRNNKCLSMKGKLDVDSDLRKAVIEHIIHFSYTITL